ncbi:MAG: DUF4347 domain-containing protein [Phormidesmis sp.]
MITFSPSVFAPARRLSEKFVSQKPAHSQPGRGMLIAIDASVDHGDALAAGAIKGARLLMIDSKRCAIAQITQAIHRFGSDFQSLHIVTHGSSGCLHFSSGDLTLSNLSHYAAEIESWFSYRFLNKGSKIRIQPPESFLSLYACSVATGDAGEEFLAKMQYLAGVTVHASRGKVGSTALNGSWKLDVSYPFPNHAKFPFTEDLLETYEAVI